MLPNSDSSCHNLAETPSIERSTWLEHLRVLNDSRLFIESSEKHIVELTRLDPDTSQDPATLIFTDAPQLSEHFRNTDYNHSGMEILWVYLRANCFHD